MAASALVLPSGRAHAQATGCEEPPAPAALMGTIADGQRIADLRAAATPDRSGDPLRTASSDLARSGCPPVARNDAEGLPGLVLLPAAATLEYRSAYPSDVNNGVRWAGRGVSASVIGGVSAAWGPLQAVVAPTVAWHQNARVAIASRAGSFRYPYHSIDWPQRFGDGADGTLHPGQSSLHLALGPVGVRLASENLWWGPAHRYPILLSNTGPGFPHLAVSTQRPLWAGIGYVRARVMWGRLDESRFFDEVPGNDHRLLSGAFVELEPWFLPGLSIGGGLFYHLPWEDVSSRVLDIFSFALTEQEGSSGNALASLTGRWVLPASGFEVYVEWAREDFWLNTEDLLTEPDHSQGYTLGFAKLLEGATSWLVQGELTHLQSAPTWQTGRSSGRPTFFVHSRVRQGHTHGGQLLGSSVGPGADAQFLAVTRMGPARSLGLYLERVRRDEDAYYQRFGDLYGFRGHDVEWTVGAHGVEPLESLSLDWRAGLSRRKNRGFIGLDGRSWDLLRETNLTLQLRVVWRPDDEIAASRQDGDGGGR